MTNRENEIRAACNDWVAMSIDLDGRAWDQETDGRRQLAIFTTLLKHFDNTTLDELAAPAAETLASGVMDALYEAAGEHDLEPFIDAVVSTPVEPLRSNIPYTLIDEN
ncbi:hypothetical protein [Gryllotalpicola koreensis]|uniref:Uncharacterized protein n=1 Tax=Gryllotalpicola koreensis TaxID=993086 RepID=A0ABP8A359_9MICO